VLIAANGFSGSRIPITTYCAKDAAGMSDTRQNNASTVSEPKIPLEQAAELRRLSHDLSNALEVILQTNYLLGMTETGEDSTKWREILDNGVQQATQINQKLRDYVRSNS
jgi:hypothetical protein